MLRSFFVCWSITLLLGCTAEKNPPVQNLVVARVGTEELKAKEFAQQIMLKAKHLDAVIVKDPSTIQRIKTEVVRDFIVKAFLKNWSKEKNVVVDQAQFAAEIERLEKNYPNNTAFVSALTREGLSYEQWKDNVRFTLLERRLFQDLRAKFGTPTESEIQIYYDHNKDRFKKNKSVKVRQVVIDTEEGAREIQKELKKGKPLSKLAQKFSIAPEGKNGGLTDWIDTSTLDVYEEVYNLKVGATSNILKSPYGFHIIELVDTRPGGQQNLKDVKEVIRKTLLEAKEQAAFSQWLEEQIRSNKVFKNDELIATLKISTEDK